MVLSHLLKKRIIAVGDGGSEEPVKEKPGKINWLTKPLNKFEQAAAENFPGGEKAYREKQKELDSQSES